MLLRVEVEFLSGPTNALDRRFFEKVRILDFVQDSHIRIVSVDEGEMIVKWNRLQWYHSQPIAQLNGSEMSMDDKIIEASRDHKGLPGIQKIMAIKKRRELTGEGLKEAKEYVDNLFRKMGL